MPGAGFGVGVRYFGLRVYEVLGFGVEDFSSGFLDGVAVQDQHVTRT